MARKQLVTGIAAVVFGLAAAVSIRADDINHTMYLKFNRPVALPGVTLGTGTYIFEVGEPSAHNVVRVLSRNRRLVYLTAFTNRIERPAGLPRESYVSFGEAPANLPQPITVWWPVGASGGRQFIYEQK
jgi:hypothetical protein